MSTGISGFGTLLKRGDGATMEAFTTIAEVRNIEGPSPEGESVDITNHDSENQGREKKAGPLDPGENTFEMNFLPGTAGHKALISDMVNRTERNFQIVYPDSGGTTWPFTAIVQGVSPTAPIDDALVAEVTLELTKVPTYPA